MENMEIMQETLRQKDEEAKKKRIKVYKTIVNYYKGRSFNLDVILSSKQPSISFPSSNKSYDDLKKSFKGLHDDISYVQSLKSCLKLMNNTLTCAEIMKHRNFNFKNNISEILNKIEGIIYFSKSIMEMYNKCYSELDLIQRAIDYSSALAENRKHLDLLRKKKYEEDTENGKEIESAEFQIYKINLTRAMKEILIAFISVNHPEALPQIKQFRNQMKRNLVIEDFDDTWDVGLSS